MPGAERYVIPEHIGSLSVTERVAWLRKDVADSDGYSGVPKFEPRYTERESQIVHLMGLEIDRLRALTVDAEFTALDWFDIKDRGPVATVAWGRTAGEARALRGTRVTIDGNAYTVTGVETHAMADSYIEEIIGLLVRADTPDRGGP